MNIIKNLFIIQLLAFGVTISCHAEIVMPAHVITTEPRVKSVEWKQNGHHQTFPVININNTNSLTLCFDIIGHDDIDNSFSWLQCSLEHRNIDWEGDNSIFNEIVDNFNVFDIGYGEPSVPGLTTVPYRHYTFSVSTDELGIKLSGNYMLNVFLENNPDSILLSVPFMVEEQTVKISGSISPVTDIDYKNGHQQLSVTVENERVDNRVGPQDIIVEIGRNNEINYLRKLTNPTGISKNKFVYEHQKQLIFDAGNEYNRFSTTSTNHQDINIEKVEWLDPFYHHFIKTDSPRGNQNYIYDETQFGGFTIHEHNSDHPEIESDYSIVHFFLDLPEQSSRDIYILGDGTGIIANETNRMLWDDKNKIYTKSFFLKQGVYDYKYFTSDENLLNLLEGNYSDTRNQFRVSVYYRIPGERYDRLAGTTLLRSYTTNR